MPAQPKLRGGAVRPDGLRPSAVASDAGRSSSHLQQQQQQLRERPQQVVVRDKYERLNLMEAGWDSGAAAAACPARLQGSSSRGGHALGPSTGSVSSGARQRSSRSVGLASGAPKRTDRVNRYRELQDQWSRDR